MEIDIDILKGKTIKSIEQKEVPHVGDTLIITFTDGSSVILYGCYDCIHEYAGIHLKYNRSGDV